MPQLLNYLGQEEALKDAIDWGTLAIYTCPRNCAMAEDGYREEMMWRQCISYEKKKQIPNDASGSSDSDDSDEDEDDATER